MATRKLMARALPAILALMGVAVILMLAGSDGTGFVLGLVVVGIAAVLLCSMFISEVAAGGPGRSARRRPYRGTHIPGL